MHSRSLCILVTLVITLPLRAQNAPAPTPKFAFDAVSIRPADPNEQGRMAGFQPTMVRAIGMPLSVTLNMAFIKQGFPGRDLIQGMPAWANNDWYDITGKFDEPTAQALAKIKTSELQGYIQPLLQALLVERCKLVFHRVPTEVPGFAIVISKGGPKLTPAAEGEVRPDMSVRLIDGGRMVPLLPGQPPVLHFFHATIAELARQLAANVPIVDQTGLAGQFNFDLRRTDLDNSGLDTDADPYTRAHYWDIAPLGLELKPIKVPVEKIVIDSIQKPSPN